MNTATKTAAKTAAAKPAAKASQPAPQTIELSHVKETKGTHVYGTEDDGAFCTQVYIRKDKLPATAPAKITLTLAVVA